MGVCDEFDNYAGEARPRDPAVDDAVERLRGFFRPWPQRLFYSGHLYSGCTQNPLISNTLTYRHREFTTQFTQPTASTYLPGGTDGNTRPYSEVLPRISK